MLSVTVVDASFSRTLGFFSTYITLRGDKKRLPVPSPSVPFVNYLCKLFKVLRGYPFPWWHGYHLQRQLASIGLSTGSHPTSKGSIVGAVTRGFMDDPHLISPPYTLHSMASIGMMSLALCMNSLGIYGSFIGFVADEHLLFLLFDGRGLAFI